MRISFYFVFKASILLLFLHSMHLWITWNVPSAYIALFVSFIIFFYSIIANVKYKITFAKILGAVFLVSAFYIGYTLHSVNAVIGPFLLLLPCLLLLFLKDSRILFDLLDFIANFFAIILPISLFIFLLTFINLPSVGTIAHPSGNYGDFNNYIFAFRSGMYGIRFSAMFLEPGHLGMISAYLLYALKFNLKDIRVLSILFCSLFTLSLAAYVLIILGYIFNLFASKRLSFRHVFSGIVFMGFLYLVSSNYNDGDNIVNNSFFSRLQPSEDKVITGNNRTFGLVDDFYEIFLTNKDMFLWGLGVDNYNLITENTRFGGAGIKIYILRQGLISAMFVLLAYLFIGLSLSKNWRYTFCFVLLLSISFWQRAYPFWASWLIPFIAGVSYFDLKEEEQKI